MTSSFPQVPLGSFLTHRKEFFTLDDTARYKRVRVQLHNKGIVLRDIVRGAELRTKKQQAVRAGDLLVAEIDAKVGGFGIVPPEIDQAIVSSHYFLYEIDETRCLRGWLDAFIRSGGMQEQVRARGSTNYAAIRPEHVLDFEMPLPPAGEQRRIVARIEEIADKVENARGLRRQAVEETKALFGSALHNLFNSGQGKIQTIRPIATFSTILRGRGPIYREGSGRLAINQKCVRWSGVDIAYAKEVSDEWVQNLPSQYFLQESDVAVNSTGEGTIGRGCVVTPNAIGLPFDSHVLVIRANKETVTPRYLAYFLRSPSGQAAVEKSKGAKTTKQTELGTAKLGDIALYLASIEEQQHIVTFLDDLLFQVNALERLQAETAAELDALLPSVLHKAFKGEL